MGERHGQTKDTHTETHRESRGGRGADLVIKPHGASKGTAGIGSRSDIGEKVRTRLRCSCDVKLDLDIA